MTLLVGRGVLSLYLGNRMRRAVGFRNVLVHEYVHVDDHVVLARLEDTSDLAKFARQVAEWLASA